MSPETATFDLNSGVGVDVVLTVNPTNGVTFSSILVDGAEITKTDKYSVSGGTVITMKKEYLATWTEGAHTITLVMSSGNNPTVTIEIIDTTA